MLFCGNKFCSLVVESNRSHRGKKKKRKEWTHIASFLSTVVRAFKLHHHLFNHSTLRHFSTMPRLELGYEELDFEDMLANFEKKFSQCERGRELYEKRPEQVSTTAMSQFDFRHLESELRTLCYELIQHIMHERNKVISPTATDSADFSQQVFDAGISKEVFKTEIRTTLAQLRDFQVENDTDIQSGSQKTTIRSIKRLLVERTEALESLEGKHRQLDHQKRRLEEKLDNLTKSAADCHRRHIPMEAEVLELREQNDTLKKERLNSQQTLHRLTAEKQRFQSTIARYREELQLSQHQTESAQLEVLQSRNQVIELEKRAAEAKASSTAVSARVKELQEVQDAMMALMKEAQVTADVGTVRRNLADLGEKRSRLVGRIANLLTTKGRNHENDTSPHETEGMESKTLTVVENPAISPRTLPKNLSEEPSDHSESSNENISTPPTTAETGNKKPILDSLRKIGTELARSGTHRAQRKSILANMERSRAAIENDSTLREVIEMKEKELERMEDELLNAKEKAAALERSLQKERHRKRLESRSSHSVKEERQASDTSTIALSRRRSLFGWQAAENDNEDACTIQGTNPFPTHEDDADMDENDEVHPGGRREEEA